jgi:hypothetical protein
LYCAVENKQMSANWRTANKQTNKLSQLGATRGDSVARTCDFDFLDRSVAVVGDVHVDGNVLPVVVQLQIKQ